MPSYAAGTDLVGRPRRRLRAHVLERDTHCWICLLPLHPDRDARRDPLGSVVDEVIPRSPRHGGGSPLDPTNCRGAHRICNGKRGVKPLTGELQQACRTAILALLNAQPPTINPW